MQQSRAALQELERIYQERGLMLELPTCFAPSFRAQLDCVCELAPPILSFTFGILPAEDVSRLKRRGCFVIGTATNFKEAQAWADVGADAICLQGAEAGGHRGTFIGDFDSSMVGIIPLLRSVRDQIDLPLIAAGGVMDGYAVRALLSMGADWVQMGTAFLFCDEVALNPAYLNRLISSGAEDTVVTRAFSGKPARGIANHMTCTMASKPVSPYPIQNALTSKLRQWAGNNGNAEYMSLWAGQGVGQGRCMPLGSLLQQIEREMHE